MGILSLPLSLAARTISRRINTFSDSAGRHRELLKVSARDKSTYVNGRASTERPPPSKRAVTFSGRAISARKRGIYAAAACGRAGIVFPRRFFRRSLPRNSRRQGAVRHRVEMHASTVTEKRPRNWANLHFVRSTRPTTLRPNLTVYTRVIRRCVHETLPRAPTCAWCRPANVEGTYNTRV